MEEDLLNRLQDRPALSEIESTIAHFSQQPLSSKLIMILLNHTIPETYSSLPSSVKILITKYLQTLQGLGNLMAKIGSFKTAPLDSKPILQSYISQLYSIIDDSLVTRLVKKGTPSLECKEVDKLLYKGKTFSICVEIFTKFEISTENSIFASSDLYVGYLTRSIRALYLTDINLSTINMYIHSLKSFSTNGLNHYFDVFFNESDWKYFTKSFNVMKSFEKREILVSFFTKYLNAYVRSSVSDDALVGLFEIMEFSYKYLNERLIDQITICLNPSLNTIISMILTRLQDKELNALLIKLFNIWGDSSLIKSEPFVIQQSRTEFLITLLSFKKGSPLLDRIMADKAFLDAISTRLSSNSNSIKDLSIILANKICEFSGKDKIFKEHLAEIEVNVRELDVITTNQKSWRALQVPFVQEPVQGNTTGLETSASRLAISQSTIYTSDSDSDDDTDDEDPTVGPKVKIPKPIYIKDLLEYLNVDSKNKNAYDMTRSALKHGPTLIRQKGKFGNELIHYSDDLMSIIVGLNNQYNEKDFESLKLNFMISILVANPNTTLHLFKLLLVGDYSLQQRMMILTATSLSVRELKGFKDSSVTNSFKPVAFPSKMLPENAHKQFALDATRSPVYSLTAALQDELMEEPTKEAQEKIHGGKILRISSGLRKKQTTVRPKVEGFYKLVGNRFFYPLVTVWYEAQGIDIGEYTSIFLGQYLSTLTLILHAAYPSASNLNDMVHEMLLIIEPLIKRVNLDEVQLVESILTSGMLICDIMDGQYLISTHGDLISMIQNWLAISWEAMIDEKLKSLSAGLLLRLSQLTETFERTLMDQVNGF